MNYKNGDRDCNPVSAHLLRVQTIIDGLPVYVDHKSFMMTSVTRARIPFINRTHSI